MVSWFNGKNLILSFDESLKLRLRLFEVKFARFLKKARRVMSFLALAVILAQVISPLAEVWASGSRDYDANAVIYGGAYSISELISKINRGDGRHNDLKKIFDTLGIYEPDLKTAKDGVVTKSGEVLVNNKVVATNVYSGGRSYMAGSTKDPDLPLYWRHPSVSFASSSIPAFVYFGPSGEFVYAIIKSCGNPVAKVIAPRFRPHLSIEVQVANITRDRVWRPANEARPCDRLRYLLNYVNDGPVSSLNTVVVNRLPAPLIYVPRSTTLSAISLELNDKPMPDGVTTSGINIGTLRPGRSNDQVVKFYADIPCNFRTNGYRLVDEGQVTAPLANLAQDQATTVIRVTEEPSLGAILGVKFNDLNGNGIREADEPGISGVRFSLNGGRSVTSDAHGNFSFGSLTPGEYTVTEVVPSGWVPTTPTSRTVRVSAGQTVTLTFGNRLLPTVTNASIIGFKFNDLNGNGLRDGDEPGLGGFNFRLNTGVVVTSNPDGSFVFPNLPPGEYTIVEESKEGWLSTTPNPITVVVGSSNVSVSFGNRQAPRIANVLPRVGAGLNIFWGVFFLLSSLYLYFREKLLLRYDLLAI